MYHPSAWQKLCILYMGGDGQWGPQILPKLCPPHPAPSSVPVQCLSLLPLTCRDSGKVPPPFLALQSAENRHADLQTGDREGLHGQWTEVPFLNLGPPHPTLPPPPPLHPSRHYFSGLRHQTRMLSKLFWISGSSSRASNLPHPQPFTLRSIFPPGWRV